MYTLSSGDTVFVYSIETGCGVVVVASKQNMLTYMYVCTNF